MTGLPGAHAPCTAFAAMPALARLEAETHADHHTANGVWLALLRTDVTPERYAGRLARAYGIEQPLEAALAYTPHVSSILPPRRRASLLAADLRTLGRPLPAARAWIAPFPGLAEAFGWLYVFERSARLHSMICGNVLANRPELGDATCYLDDRTALARWRALGVALDRIARTPRVEDRIVAAAHSAFHTVIDWYARAEPAMQAIA
jgi:heme oxygenase